MAISSTPSADGLKRLIGTAGKLSVVMAFMDCLGALAMVAC